MISESRYWKDDLLRLAEQLRRARMSTAPLSLRRYATIEKAALVGAFIVRRLIESLKVSSRISGMRLRVTRIPSVGKRVTIVNRDRLYDLFDFKRAARGQEGLRRLCNQAIHSYVLAPYVDRTARRVAGILVASDQNRNRALYAVPLTELERAFRRAGRDYPSYTFAVYDEKTQDYVVTTS